MFIINSNEKNIIVSQWVKDYTDQLLSWTEYKVSDKTVAEDIVQDTFIAAYNAFEKFEVKSSPKTWLFSILRNKIFDYHRNKFRNREISDSNIGSEDYSIFDRFFNQDGEWNISSRPQPWDDSNMHLLDNLDFRDIFYDCIDSLPEKWNSCIQMKFLSETDGNEICKELEITPSNYWQILHRAKLQLRDCLERNWFKRDV